ALDPISRFRAPALPAQSMVWGEQLSPKSSCEGRLPAGPGVHHGVQDREQFPHTGGQCQLLRLASSAQALDESSDHDIAAHVADRGHVESCPDWGPATPDVSGSPLETAVALEWCHPDQGGDLLAIEPA